MSKAASTDRIAGALIGMAAGDALGAPYEFTVPGRHADIIMRAGGPWAKGEWTDDTAQALGIALVTATGSQDIAQIGQHWLDWLEAGPKDIGISTGAVFARAGSTDRLAQAAADYYAEHPRGAAGNGSLMRTAPVALANLGDDQAIAHHARAVSLLSHGDPLAAEGCILWCIAIDRAIREQRLDGVRDGLALLPPDRAEFWAQRIDEAEGADPHDFSRGNGFVVTALQAAHAAITSTPIPADNPALHLQHALVEAVRVGNDTDTVAAIAGQVLGARWGASAVPWHWRRHLHGWPGLGEKDLVRLAVLTATGGHSDSIGWPGADSMLAWGRDQERTPFCVELESHGPDANGGLLLGNLPGLQLARDRAVDAVVSLCRMGRYDVPDGIEHARFWLIDQPEHDANPNLEFVLQDAARAVASLREDGKRVYLHCVGGRSRTAAVAATYLAQRDGTSTSQTVPIVGAALPDMRLNPRFARLLSNG